MTAWPCIVVLLCNLTLADLSLAPVVMMLFVTGDGGLVLERRSVSAWWDRVSARPAWQKVLAGPGREESPGGSAQFS